MTSNKVKHTYAILLIALTTQAFQIYTWNYGSYWQVTLLFMMCFAGLLKCIQFIRTPKVETLSQNHSLLINSIVGLAIFTFIMIPVIYTYLYFLAQSITESIPLGE